MRWATALSQKPPLRSAVEEAARTIEERLSGERPDLAIVFVSPHFRASYDQLPALALERLRPRVLLGCSAAGVIGAGKEVEQQPAIAVMAAVLPGVSIHAFHVDTDDLPDEDAPPGAWVDALGAAAEPTPQFVVLADPRSFDPRALLSGLDFAYAASTKIGGLASGGQRNALFLDDEVLPTGAAGVALSGDVAIDTLVAQGCKPIGGAGTVTRCQDNVLLEVDHRPPIEVLSEVYEGLSGHDRELMQTSLHLGIATSELQGPEHPREFLIRNVLGADPDQGILAIGAMLRQGQTVQFHLRDAETADDDLQQVLARYRTLPAGTQPAGALLFSCTGRGRHLFGKPNHDSDAFQGALGDVPLAGFFCAGEIGPVGGSTHLHGYTSSFGIFRPRA